MYVHRHSSEGLQIAQLLSHGSRARFVVYVVERELRLCSLLRRLFSCSHGWRLWLSIGFLEGVASDRMWFLLTIAGLEVAGCRRRRRRIVLCAESPREGSALWASHVFVGGRTFAVA